jgi:hypothetical protein
MVPSSSWGPLVGDPGEDANAIDVSDFSDTSDNVDFTGIFSVDKKLREH